MTNQDQQNVEKSDTRTMWIATAVIILVLVGGMGINFLVHRDSGSADSSSSSQMSPQK